MASYGAGVYYCPAGVGCDIPRWVFVMSAINLFIYQLFDNLDGKQVR
jgi:hypothetical protein